MLLDTSIIDNGGSLYMRIPSAMVDYYKLRNTTRPKKCKIEDIGENEAKVTFTKW